MRIYIINGANLNLLGARQPEFYGYETLDDLRALCEQYAQQHHISMRFLQSNSESQLLDWVAEASFEKAEAIIINAGAYTHSSIALLDALQIFKGFVVEVHLSNIYKREAFRHKSYISLRADCILAGLGVQAYLYGMDFIREKMKKKRP